MKTDYVYWKYYIIEIIIKINQIIVPFHVKKRKWWNLVTINDSVLQKDDIEDCAFAFVLSMLTDHVNMQMLGFANVGEINN